MEICSPVDKVKRDTQVPDHHHHHLQISPVPVNAGTVVQFLKWAWWKYVCHGTRLWVIQRAGCYDWCRYNNNKQLNGYCAHPGVSTSMTLPAVPMYIVFCWPTCNPRQCFPFNGTLPRATQSASWLPHPETSSRWHSLQSAICECSRYLLFVPKVSRLHFGMGTKTGNLPSQDKIYHPSCVPLYCVHWSQYTHDKSSSSQGATTDERQVIYLSPIVWWAWLYIFNNSWFWTGWAIKKKLF